MPTFKGRKEGTCVKDSGGGGIKVMKGKPEKNNMIIEGGALLAGRNAQSEG